MSAAAVHIAEGQSSDFIWEGGLQPADAREKDGRKVDPIMLQEDAGSFSSQQTFLSAKAHTDTDSMSFASDGSSRTVSDEDTLFLAASILGAKKHRGKWYYRTLYEACTLAWDYFSYQELAGRSLNEYAQRVERHGSTCTVEWKPRWEEAKRLPSRLIRNFQNSRHSRTIVPMSYKRSNNKTTGLVPWSSRTLSRSSRRESA